MGSILQDLRYGWRQLRRNPGFTLAAVVCLALGIGANAAAFSFAWGVLYVEPPLPSPNRMVWLYISWQSGMDYGSFSYPDYKDVRDQSGDVLETLAAEMLSPVHLSTRDENQRVWASMVSMNYFTGLGVPLARGKAFGPEDGDAPGSVPFAVLSHRAWKSRFGEDPSIVGRQVLLNGHPFTVVAVIDEEFRGLAPGLQPDLYVPILMAKQLQPSYDFLEERGAHTIAWTVGRLRPGVSFARARSELGAIIAQLRERYPDTNEGSALTLLHQNEALPHPMVRQGFVNAALLVFVVVGFILLLACANVAGLLLARAAARRKEIGMRMALGGGRLRLVRQLVVESLLLAGIAGVAGYALSVALNRSLVQAVPPTDVPMYVEYQMHPEVLLFTLAATLLTGLAFGLVPAFRATHADLVTDLKEGTPGMGGRRRTRLRSALVVAQVALSLVLLVSAGLVLRSLRAVSELDPGFRTDHQLIANLDIDLQGYDEEHGRAFLDELRRRLEQSPEVAAVGFSQILPLNFSASSSTIVPQGYESVAVADRPNVDRNLVDYGYFEAAGTVIVAGRPFLETDRADTPPVMIVNETFAKRFWPDEDPLGKVVHAGSRDFEVVGIARDGKYFSLGEKPKPYFYTSFDQLYAGNLILHVRTLGVPESVMPIVRREVAALDDKLPVANLRTMESHMRFATLPSRMLAGVVSAFALVALLLAAVGLYGVLAFWVNQAVRELAIRLALGASGGDVVGQVVRRGIGLATIGLGVGLLASFAIARVVVSLVYGVQAWDPATYGIAALVLFVAATLAALVPALRASHVDPVVILK